MMKFKNIVATDYCNRVADGTHDSPKRQDNGKFLITSRHIKGRSIDFENAYLISEEDFNQINQRSKVDQWDILISMIGEYCGFSYVERNEIVDYAVKNVGIFKTGDKIKAEWLYYYLISPDGKNTLETLRSGTSQPYIPLGALRALEIPVPEDETKMEQIVFTLSSLDDKIELNLQMNQTLESMAQAIFKEWFVNFNFPGFDGELVDGLPKGWKIGKLNDLIKILSGFAFKSIDFDDEGEYKLVTIKNVKDGLFDKQTTDKLNKLPAKMPDYCLLSEGNILLSLTGNVGRICIVTGENYLLNQRVAKLEPIKERDRAFTYFLMRSSVMKERLISISRGTAQQNLSPIEAGKLELIIPDNSVLEKYSEIVTTLFQKTIENINEAGTLTQIRDSLLPKLMTGKIEIQD